MNAAAEDLECYADHDLVPAECEPQASLVWRLVAYLAAEQLADLEEIEPWLNQLQAELEELRALKAHASSRGRDG